MIAANTGFLFQELPFLERIGAAARAGYDAVEFHDEAQREKEDDVRAALRDAGLPLLGLNTRMGETVGLAGRPGREAEAREQIEEALSLAGALGGRAVHVLAGLREDDASSQPSAEAWMAYRDNLVWACDRSDGLRVLIEPLSARAMPGYVLDSLSRAASLVEWVARPQLKIMFDVFHVASGAGEPSTGPGGATSPIGSATDLASACGRYARHVGHVQLADPDSRGAPRIDGPFAVGAMIEALRMAGYEGAFGAEYREDERDAPPSAWLATAREAASRPVR